MRTRSVSSVRPTTIAGQLLRALAWGCSTLTITAEFQIAKPSGQHIYGSTGRGGTGVETISELVVWP